MLCLKEELGLMKRHCGDPEFGCAYKGIICAIENDYPASVQEERTPVGSGHR